MRDNAGPIGSLNGASPVGSDGVRGRFRDAPLDPVDTVLGLLARGEAEADQLAAMLDSVLFGLAVDAGGFAIVRPAPDGELTVQVTTSHGHRTRVAAAGWRTVTLTQLADSLPAEGVDVLLNPGAPTSVRVLAHVVRSAAAEERFRP